MAEPSRSKPKPQDSIRTTRIGRTASLVGAGAKVGLNYLKYYGKRSVNKAAAREELQESNARDLYATLSRLKGGPLKVAQMLSIDQGLLPAAYSREFSQAQYSAPPLSYPLVARTFRREFGKEPTEIFDTFSREAAHGASIGQVHKATRGRHAYAVKVQYPGVAQSLRTDLAVVKPLALQIMGVREADVALYFTEIEERLLEETDYALELNRSQRLSRDCAHLPHIGFPKYHPELSSAKILTMDWIDGVPLDRFADSDASAAQRNRIGQALWDFYHHQIHELRLFHADPHPGNFLVQDGTLWALDFGCTKQLSADFYRLNFRLLNPSLMNDRKGLERALLDLSILLPADTARDRARFLEVFIPTMELLARPFKEEEFDFGAPGFMKAIYEIGESNRQNGVLRSMKGARGSRHAVYLNRAYFGLYSLLARLRARVRLSLPEVAREKSAAG